MRPVAKEKEEPNMKKKEKKCKERKDNGLMVDMHAIAIAIVGPL